jgi:nucleoside-diphosphate kinase
MERTFVMIKPDATSRGLIGKVISKLEGENLRVVAMKMLLVDRARAERLYGVHRGKPFYDGLVEYIMSGPVVAMVLEGEDAIAKVRRAIGATDPAKAEPGTIRREFGLSIRENVVHAADSPENARREIEIFFEESEIVGGPRINR